MKRILLSAGCAVVLGLTPVAAGRDVAAAGNNFVKGLIGGVIAGAIIGSIVRAGQSHCHQGLGCHSHGYANANHYHQYINGPILYYQAVAPAPPPQAVGFPPQHYQWCAAKYRSYHAPTNSYQPYGNVPRRPCVSPFG